MTSAEDKETATGPEGSTVFGSPAWVLVGAGVSGISTYGVQVVVGRAVGLQPFADFSLFWATTLIAALGFFLPLEQETARRVAGSISTRANRSRIWRRACVAAGGVVITAAVLGTVAWQSSSLSPVIMISFFLACLGYGLQFPARGVLAGQRRLAAYSAVVTTDSLLRLVAALMLLVVGVKSADVYALVVAASSLVAGLMATVLAQVQVRGTPDGPVVSGLIGNSAGLVLAASCMQLLLNSGTLIARIAASPDQQVAAAHLISFMTLARLPVFVFQALQAVYVSRLASHVHQGDTAEARELVRSLAALAVGMALATVAGAALLGPWAIEVFGPGFRIDAGSAAVIGVSVAFYLVASVSNDVLLAVGRHRRIVAAWPAAVVVALIAALGIQDLLTRSTLPLIVAAIVAAVLLITGLRPHLRVTGQKETA